MLTRLNRTQLALALAGLAATPFLMGAGNPPATAAAKGREYLAHWGITTWTSKTKGVDYQSMIDLSGTSIARDLVMLYEDNYGKYPYAGVHMYFENAKWKTDHFARMAKDINTYCPDPNFAGYICIDYETWQPNWKHQWNQPSNLALDARDSNFKDDWEKWIKLNHPNWLAGKSGAAYQAVLETKYNEASKQFFLDTLNETKRLRPKAKVGYYCFPVTEFYTDYAPRSTVWHTVNDELKWMFDAEDVIFPCTYQIVELVEGKALAKGKPQAYPKDNGRYIVDNVKEAVRVGQGKPVLDFIWFRYHDWLGAPLAFSWVPDTAMKQMIELPKEAGADGVVIWDCIQSKADYDAIRTLIMPKASKMIDPIAVKPVPPGSPGAVANNNAGNRSNQANGGSASASANNTTSGDSSKNTGAGAVVLPNGRVIVSSAPH